MTRLNIRPFTPEFNQLGLSLNIRASERFDIVKTRHRTENVNGQILTSKINESLLRRLHPRFPQMFQPRINFGLWTYLKWMEIRKEINIDNFAHPRFVRFQTEAENSNQLSVHSRAIRKFISKDINNTGLILLHGNCTIEETVNSLVLAFPEIRILILAEHDKTSRRIRDCLREARLAPLFMTRKQLRHDHQLQPHERIAISTTDRSHNIFAEFSLIVTADAQVLQQDNFHAMFGHDRVIFPRLFGILKNSERHVVENNSQLFEVFGFKRLHLKSDSRIRRDISHARLTFRHGESKAENWTLRKRYLESTVFNHRRNRRIFKLVAHLRRNETKPFRGGTEICKWVQQQQTCNIVIVIDELQHAYKLLKELPNWRLVTKDNSEKIEELSFRNKIRETLSNASKLECFDGLVVVSDSMRKAKRFSCDLIIYAGANPMLPEIPQNWMFAQEAESKLLIVDVNDSGDELLARNSRSRLESITARGIRPIFMFEEFFVMTQFEQMLRREEIR